MDPILGAVLSIAMRWIHILSVVVVLGGLTYSRAVLVPSLALLPDEKRSEVAAAANLRFRPWVRLAIFLMVVSGLYNLVMKANIPPGSHIWFGIKMLLALHIIA